MSGMPVPGVRIEKLRRSWGGVDVLHGIDLAVAPGTLAVLLGPSGCGKSTILRLIAGLDAPDGGRVFVGERDVTALPPSGRDLSMVFQNYALFPHLDVRENILFGLKMRRMPAAERARRLDRAAETLGLGPLLGRKPSQLSGGQQQRVALGRALVSGAPLCLMDEPLSNLDAQLRQDMRREIRELQQRLGLTLLYVTHDQTEAMSMADQVILMRAGTVEQAGPPEALYRRPETLFAARFVGIPPMNLLALAESDEGGVVAGTEGPVMVPGGGAGRILGLRPEDIAVGPAGGTGLAATLVSAEYHGADTLLTCRAGRETLTLREAGLLRHAPGTVLRLSWPAEAQHLFDAGTGRRCPHPIRPDRRAA
jgi:sn-glycerol 3-phosphate transport system ATP-binding protein